MANANHTPSNEPSDQDWDDFWRWAERDKIEAARYRWLRDHKAYVAVQPHYKDLPKAQRTGWTIRLVCGNDASFDGAIDAAMDDHRGLTTHPK